MNYIFFRSGEALQLSFTNNQCQVKKITLFYKEIKQYLIENVELECVLKLVIYGIRFRPRS